MKHKNCPNCGAPIDIEKNKCAYCGTSYYDLSLMPLREPFFLKVNVGTRDKPQIITAKVFCSTMNINYAVDCVPEIEMEFQAIDGLFRETLYL